MRSEGIKVGKLARRTGLTVRTLHHYEAVGLLKPQLRTESGHRLYTTQDLARLQQVLSLRQLGFSLDEIRAILNQRTSPLEVIHLHVHRLREQIEQQQGLVGQLETLARQLSAAEAPTADQLIASIERTRKVQSYFSPEQLERVQALRAGMGEERMQEASRERSALTERFRKELEAGTDPTDPKVQSLAAQLDALLGEFTGGDPDIETALSQFCRESMDEQVAKHIRDNPPAVADYTGKALRAFRAGP